MFFFQFRSYMLEIKVSSWQYDAMCRQHSSNLFFPPATFEKKEDRVKRLEFDEKIDELNQETDTLLDEIEKWQM